MKILFHENELNYRGTSIAMYDYADFNEKYLGNESIIIYNKTLKTNHLLGIEKFEKRFKVIAYEDIQDLDKTIARENIDLLYTIKNGNKDEVVTKLCKQVVHTVFKHNEPHGDVYAYVSEWLSQEMTGGQAPFVPHMVNFETIVHHDLRNELNIPAQAKVFGYYGGGQSFNIKFAQKAVEQIASKNKDIYFIFMGVDTFIVKKWWKKFPKNVLFLPASNDVVYKQKFINTCNALLHARERGETFGITIAEFAIKGKPVITFGDSPEKNHIMELKDQGYYYSNIKELKDIILESPLDLNPAQNYSKFLPQPVMDQFKRVFID